jgi:hypothetical protein
LKSFDHFGLLVVFLRLWLSASCDDDPHSESTMKEIGMSNNVLSYLVAGTLGVTLALVSPALAFHGGGGGMHGGGMAGGMHVGSMGGGMGGDPHFSGSHFAGGPFAAHAAFSPRFSRFGFRDHRFFHHPFNRFAFFGAPFAYAAYDGCWREVWTRYGPRWVDVCGDYGY